MGVNVRMETVPALNTSNLDLTFTANAPTPADTQTIADGSSMTAAESGQFAANVEAKLAAIVLDLTALRAAINAGEE